MASMWEALAKVVDAGVDASLGELVTIVPWIKSDFSAGAEDGSRSRVENVLAIPVMMGVRGNQTGTGFLSQHVQSDRKLSIRKEYMEGFDQGDRVIFVDRDNETWEILLVEPSVTDRPFVHLVRIKDAS